MNGFNQSIDLSKLPVHIAIIMDGNGRWARNLGKDRFYGHKQAVNIVREIVEASAEIGIKYLTLYTFSIENWQRPKTEIKSLMQLLVNTMRVELKKLLENNIKLEVIGDIQKIDENTRTEVLKAVERTRNNTGMNLIMALSYSSKWDIINAVKKIANDTINNNISLNDLDENIFSKYLSTFKVPNPDLLIRTGGEYRISNFLLWELAYTELYFTEKKWPEFTKTDFYEAICNYQERERRFGKTSEQLN